MKAVRVAIVVLLALTLSGGAVSAQPLREQGPVPVTEGSWLGSLETSCTQEVGLTLQYHCDFAGSAPAEFPPGSHCTETPAGPIVVSLECTASLGASTVGRIGRAGCLTAPTTGQVLTTNGDVTVFSSAMQQAYNVPVKVWVSRGVGHFSGVANYPLAVASVSGSFSTHCGELQSTGVFRGQFSIGVIGR